MAESSAGWRRAVYAREARTLHAFERRAVGAARTTTVVNDREAFRLERDYPDADIEILQNGIDVEAFRPTTPPSSSPTVVFTGVMNYQPNVDAVTWFASRIWPEVRARRGDAGFAIVGASPGRDVVALAERDTSIDVTGAVPAVQPALWSGALAVAPVRLAQGVQNKVLEAVAAGLPAVVTQAVWDGLPDAVRPACALATDEQSFADEVVALLNMTPQARRAHAERASLEEVGWPTRLAGLEPLLKRVLQPRAAQAVRRTASN